VQQHPMTQLSLSLLLQCCPNFSDQISEVGSCDGVVVIKIASQYNSISIPEYSCHNITSRHNDTELSGRWRRGIFQDIFCTLFSGSKLWGRTHLPLKIVKHTSGDFSSTVSLVDSLTQLAFWTSNNICFTHRTDTYFINKFSIKIECALPVEMPTDVAMKPAVMFVDVLNSFFIDGSCRSST